MKTKNTTNMVLAILLAVILVGACAWTYREYTSTKTETTQVFNYGYTIQVSHAMSSEVGLENPIYPVGTSLVGMAGYFYNISPEALVDISIAYAPSEDSSLLAVNSDTVLLLQKIDDEGTPFWMLESNISSSSFTLTGTSEHTDRLELDCQEISSFFEQTEESLDSTVGSPIGLLRTTVSYQGTVSSKEFADTQVYDMPIVFGPDYYYMGEYDQPGPITENYYSPVVSVVEKDLSDIFVQLAAVAVVAILLIAVLATGGHKRNDLEFFSKHKEWVSTGVYPGGEWEKEVYVPELQDLIDVAIDSNKRVIYDAGEKLFFVIDSKILYYLIVEEEE